MDDIREGRCPVCRHHEIIKAKLQVYGARRLLERVFLVSGPSPERRGEREERGEMRAFTCRSCGYTQLFAESPVDIPIDDEWGTELITSPAGVEPFR